jgi:hypothetical protein
MIMESIYSSVEEVWKNRAEIAEIAKALGALGAFFGGFKFLSEYSRENKRKRIETYVAMQDKIAEDRNIKIVCILARYRTAKGDEKVRVAREIIALPLEERTRFAFLLEDVAMRTNSGLVRRDVISEIFGWWAIEFWDNDNFWVDVRNSRDDEGWYIVRDFVDKMKRERRPPFSWARHNRITEYLDRQPWFNGLVRRIYRALKKRPSP